MMVRLILSICALAAAKNNVKYELFSGPDCQGSSDSFSYNTPDYCVSTPSSSVYFQCTDDDQVKYSTYDESNCQGSVTSETVYQTGECISALLISYRATCSKDDPCFGRDATFACRVLEPNLSAEAAFDACFSAAPASDKAERVLMASLSAGDIVLSSASDGPAKTTVIVNQHMAELKTSTLLHLHHAQGSLTLTADHVLYLNGRFVPAREAKEGDLLVDASLAAIKIARITTSRGAVVNPITADGKILAADAEGEPVLAATANEWLADVLLHSSYPQHTLSFMLSSLLPQTVQAYYDAVLEPFFHNTVPSLSALKAAVPSPVVAAALVLGDLLLATGLIFFAVSSLKVVAALGLVIMVAHHRRVTKL